MARKKSCRIQKVESNNTYSIVVSDPHDSNMEYVVIENIDSLKEASIAQLAAENAFNLGRSLLASLF